MPKTDNHSLIKQMWPDLDEVIQFLSNERRHLDDFHPNWADALSKETS